MSANHDGYGKERPGLLVSLLVGLVAAFIAGAALATWPKDSDLDGVRPKYAAVIETREEYVCGVNQCVEITARLNDGKIVPLGSFGASSPIGSLPEKTAIILGYEKATDTYLYYDRDRRVNLVWLALVFIIMLVFFARIRGLLAVASLTLSVLFMYYYTAPALASGSNPVTISLITAATIAVGTTLMSHGYNLTSSLAVLSMVAAILVSWIVAVAVFPVFGLTGGMEESAQYASYLFGGLDLVGILIGGALIGAVGALDDVVLTQITTVRELSIHGDRASTIKAAMRVGRTHVVSSTNTLAMAYLSASMPLLLLFAATETGAGLVLSSEEIVVEILRMFIGTTGLVLSVPLATILASFAYAKNRAE